MSVLLKVQNLKVKVGHITILNGIELSVKKGELHVIMGPNGSGKSTLVNVIMGNPKYDVVEGAITFFGKDILSLKPEERAGLGIFMAFQYPKEIAGLDMDRFLFTAYKNLKKLSGAKQENLSVFEFKNKIEREMKLLKMKTEIVRRSLNEGFSGGEKKKAEMLQLALFEPKLAMLDETDSGLDVDALKIVGQSISRYKNKERGILLVTHYQRILEYIKPDFIHIMIAGRIVKTGKRGLARDLEKSGYEKYTKI